MAESPKKAKKPPMPSLSSVKERITRLVSTAPAGLTLGELNKAYKDDSGNFIPFEAVGFESISVLLIAMQAEKLIKKKGNQWVAHTAQSSVGAKSVDARSDMKVGEEASSGNESDDSWGEPIHPSMLQSAQPSQDHLASSLSFPASSTSRTQPISPVASSSKDDTNQPAKTQDEPNPRPPSSSSSKGRESELSRSNSSISFSSQTSTCRFCRHIHPESECPLALCTNCNLRGLGHEELTCTFCCFCGSNEHKGRACPEALPCVKFSEKGHHTKVCLSVHPFSPRRAEASQKAIKTAAATPSPYYQEAAKLAASTAPTPVEPKTQSKPKSCLSCGEQGHAQSHCPYRVCENCGGSGDGHGPPGCPATCSKCGALGHKGKECQGQPDNVKALPKVPTTNPALLEGFGSAAGSQSSSRATAPASSSRPTASSTPPTVSSAPPTASSTPPTASSTPPPASSSQDSQARRLDPPDPVQPISPPLDGHNQDRSSGSRWLGYVGGMAKKFVSTTAILIGSTWRSLRRTEKETAVAVIVYGFLSQRYLLFPSFFLGTLLAFNDLLRKVVVRLNRLFTPPVAILALTVSLFTQPVTQSVLLLRLAFNPSFHLTSTFLRSSIIVESAARLYLNAQRPHIHILVVDGLLGLGITGLWYLAGSRDIVQRSTRRLTRTSAESGLLLLFIGLLLHAAFLVHDPHTEHYERAAEAVSATETTEEFDVLESGWAGRVGFDG